MLESPAVTIVIPMYNDEAWIRQALDSCLAQSRREIEVICVDDASTDGTATIAQEYAERDARVRVLQQPVNGSAFQARRAGVDAATAKFVLFLDGDDELAPHAVQTAFARAQETDADVVGFGVEVLTPPKVKKPAFAQQIQPKHDQLVGTDVFTKLFPVGKPAHGHIWGYLFATELLQRAYSHFGEDVQFYRANDVPITTLALAAAQKYASVPDQLYRYHFRRGTSGHAVASESDFDFYLQGLASIESASGAISDVAQATADPDRVLRSFASVRRSVIATLLRYCAGASTAEVQNACVTRLEKEVGRSEILLASADFCPQVLPVLTRLALSREAPRRDVKHVLLSTWDLKTGGVQAVVAAQAQHFVDAGFTVTIALQTSDEPVFALPDDVAVVHATGASRAERLEAWGEMCRELRPDVIIDHHVLYSRAWPYFALAAREHGIPTIGWLHSFALRSLLDDNSNASYLLKHLPMLQTVVTLSAVDVAYWKMQGLSDVVYLPNPPSQLTLDALRRPTATEQSAGPIRLVWWGRLHESVKQVRTMLRLGALLRDMDVDAHITIIGPDTPELTAADLLQDAVDLGLSERVRLTGALHGEQLIDEISSADVFVSTSVIEGYSFAIVEAQALGLPVVMYELPWLSVLADNQGVIAVAQSDVTALASTIADLSNDRDRLGQLAANARTAAQRQTQFDFATLYAQLVTSALPEQFSPNPTIADAELLLDWSRRYAERSAERHERDERQLVSRQRQNRELRQQVATWRTQALALRKRVSDQRSRISQLEAANKKLSASEAPQSNSIAARAMSAVSKVRKRIVETTKKPRAHLSANTARTAERAPATGVGAKLVAAEPRVDVSVVIPVYNSEGWLEQCISSVLAQTGVSLEVICINDGSTDGSARILGQLAARDSRVRVIDQPNQGQSVARNTGVDAAQGRFIAYLDSDDYWQGDSLAKLVEAADRLKVDVLQFEGHAFKDGDVDETTWARYAHYYPRSREYAAPRSGLQMMSDMREHRDYRVHVGFYLSRTDYVREIEVRSIPGIVHQDNPYTFTLLANAKSVAHMKVDLYARRLREGSTITTLQAANSAKGYFLGYVAIQRQLATLTPSPPQAVYISDIVYDIFNACRNSFSELPDSIAESIRSLDQGTDAQVISRILRATRKS